MSHPREPQPVKLIVGLLYNDDDVQRQVLAILMKEFGPLDFVTRAEKFTYTSYYNGEMGMELLRQTCSFLDLVAQERLPDIKHFTNELEERFSLEGKRRINIDPGLLTPERLVLATGKNYTHRIYLRDGIYADLTLFFQGGSFHALPWTYPDYRSPTLIPFLNALRQKVLFQQRGKLPRRDFFTPGKKGVTPWFAA